MRINNRIIKFIIAAWVLFYAMPCSSSVAFYHYGIENGLPEARINFISQDSTGFIWLAGENNLYRFDGHQFQVYQNSTIHSSTVSFVRINALFTDSKGTIWVGSNNGVSYYDFFRNQFIHLGDMWKNKRVLDIAEDDLGNLWMASESGLLKYNPSSKDHTWFTGTNPENNSEVNIDLPTNYITRVTCQPRGIIWLVTEPAGLYSFNTETGEVKNHGIWTDVDLTNFNISNIRFSNEMLYAGTLAHGLFRFDPKKEIVHQEIIEQTSNAIHHFQVQNDSILWLATNSGLFRYNCIDGNYTKYTNISSNPLSLNRTTLQYIYLDKEKNIWASSGISGVDYGLTEVPFSHFYISEKGGPYYLNSKEVLAIHFEETGNMWLAYESGLVEKHTNDPLAKIQYKVLPKNPAIQSGSVLAIFEDDKQRIWAGGWMTGFTQLNPKNQTFEPAPVKPDSISELIETGDVRAITQDKNGNIWISFHGTGLGKYNPKTQEMKLYRQDLGNPTSGLSNNYIYSLCFDDDHNIWVASAHGVSRMNTETEKFSVWFNEEENHNSLNSNAVNTVYRDVSGTIWAGTDRGLNIFLPALNNFKPVLTDEDFPFLNVSAIQSVNPGEIWLSTQSGIFRVRYTIKPDGKNLDIKTTYLNRSDGLLSSNYFPRSAGNTSGTIYFAGNEGIDFFEPGDVSFYKELHPNILITEIISDGEPVLPFVKSHEEGKLVLNHSNQILSIRFAALNFNNTGIRKYRYKLKGVNDDWIYLQNEQQATFTHLHPGSYIFRVETLYKNNWRNENTVLHILVKRPFYMTTGFYILAAFLLIGMVLLMMNARSKVLILRQKKLEQVIEERTLELQQKNKELELANQTKDKFFSIISHDLRSPFLGLLGILELLTEPDLAFHKDKQTELLQAAKKSAQNTFELLENLLMWSRSQMKNTTCNIEKHNISEVLRKNISLKKEIAIQKKISVSEDFADKMEAFFDEDMINTVIRNLFNNAIKFTHPGGKVNIMAENKNGEVKISISDTGIGLTGEETLNLFEIDKSNRNGTSGEKGTGLGLVICKEFVEKNNGEIWAEPNKPSGTIFHFTLPAANN
jgi:signal transduction histidine kinase/ligand-binding sensor domain-containing protein